MQEEKEGTRRGDGIRRRYGGKHGGKKGKVRREKGHITQHAPILFYKKRKKKDRLTTEADSLLERKGISRRLIVPPPEVLLTGVKEGTKKRKEKKYRR